MMFRSLLVAPLLAAADVQEQSVLLQMKGRAETQLLMQRAAEGISSETLRSLEMGVMAKGPKKVETAKCAYHMKTAKEDYAGKTPCEVLDVLEELYEETFDNFEEFGKIADKAITEVMKFTDKSLKNYPLNATTFEHTFEYNASTLNLQDTKFHKAFVKATDKKLGASMNETDIYGALTDHGIFDAAADAFEQIIEVQEDVVSMLKGEGLINALPVNSTFNVTAMQEAAELDTGKGRSNARKMIEAYATAKKNLFVNQVGGAFAAFWETTLDYNPADGSWAHDWTDKKSNKAAGDEFYLLASGFADEANVEDICKSEAFNKKKPMLKKVCKGSSKPKCLDELMYLHEDTEGICEVANSKAIRKVRGRKFTDQKFLDYCNATTDSEDDTKGADCELYFRDNDQPWEFCKKANDVRKGCRQIEKYEKAEAKKVLKAKKKAFNAAKKACYKACKKVERKDRKACKKECKTNFHKSMLTNWTIPEPEVPEATTE